MRIGQQPTWLDDVLALFISPYWMSMSTRKDTGAKWMGCMRAYDLDLSDYGCVKAASARIYQYLHSRKMPLTDDPAEYWPAQALETFRQWVNQGWRRSADDPLNPEERIALPSPHPEPLQMRRDLSSLSQDELDDYRMRFDVCFQVRDASADAPGQTFFAIHGDWCLHYQEAFLLWHRAYLLAFEKRLGCAVPYWNWYAEDAAIDGSPNAGLPQAFKDLTYVHPLSGELRPNPLRFATARRGVSKACMPPPDPRPEPGGRCHWVQRDPLLYTSGDQDRAARVRKIGLTRLYQQQVQRALAFHDFSHPQGMGQPWANIPSFDPPPADSLYVYRNYNFDGAYEQPHDNYHGWVGPDMADNAFTAYDPVFWSYHANIDRLFEVWLRAHATQATFTANIGLSPFAGPRANRIEFTDPRPFVYTTIGDLAKDSRALGYDFAPPASPDFGSRDGRLLTQSTGPVSPGIPRPALFVAEPAQDELLVIFDEVRCTHASFAIDAFLNLDTPTLNDVDAANPHYIGRFSRIGMGQIDDKGRCITQGVPRMLDATATAQKLQLAPGAPCSLTLLITDLASAAEVPPQVHQALPGFKGRLLWAKRGWAPADAASAPPSSSIRCCH